MGLLDLGDNMTKSLITISKDLKKLTKQVNKFIKSRDVKIDRSAKLQREQYLDWLWKD